MMKTRISLSLAMLLGVATYSSAHEAPVYDVNNLPQQQFDGAQAPARGSAPVSGPSSQKRVAEIPPDDNPLAGTDSSPDEIEALATEPTPSPMLEKPRVSLSAPSRVSPVGMGGRLEQQADMQAEMASKLEDIHAEMQTLRGQVEEMQHQIQILSSEQKTQFADLDKRVSAPQAEMPAVGMMTSKKKSAEALVTGEETQPSGDEEQKIYQIAYNQIKAKKYDSAASTLQKMLEKYPSGQFAANAHYWLGELYGLMNKNEQSITEFTAVVKNYPTSPKVADAQLKLGLIYAAQFKWADAKKSFKAVIMNYPGTSFSRLAMEQLKQIKAAGH
jgi:tol-pal system protein YbgF